MKKLIDIFNTKYFADHYATDLRYLFDMAFQCLEDYNKEIPNHIPEVYEAIKVFRTERNVQIDLADAKFVPSTMDTIMNALERGALMCDTLNIHRDLVLNENRRRKNLSYEEIPLPPLKSKDDIPLYVRNLRTDVVYTIPDYNIITQGLIVLITLSKPSVQMDLGQYYTQLFSYVSNNVILEDDLWSEYNCVYGQTIYIQKFVDGKTYILGSGEMTYEQFHNEFVYLPTCFGTKALVIDPFWKNVVDTATNDILEGLRDMRTTITDIYARRA
jgi:hypothetical protein